MRNWLLRCHDPTGRIVTAASKMLGTPAVIIRRSSGQLDEMVFQTVSAEKAPIGAYRIAKTLRAQGHDIVINQIYRVLRRLIAARRIIKVECLSAFVVSIGDVDAIMCVCRHCQAVKQVPLSDLFARLNEISSSWHMSQPRYVVETTGLCANCFQAD